MTSMPTSLSSHQADILAACHRLLLQCPYAQLTTVDFAKAAKVSPRSLYRPWRNQRGWLLALMRWRLDKQLKKYPFDGAQSGMSFLAEQSLMFYRFYAEDRDFSQAYFAQSLQTTSYFQDQLHVFAEQLAFCLRHELPQCTDARRMLVASAWVSQYLHCLLQGLVSEQPPEIWHQQLIHWCQDLVLMCRGE
ncbi:hypothetical protein VST7929_00214 [Vibrio stylophorae]|uniref:TetR/AcrR family transcriptional regulator n=1 Tax=Vibrio stylophorae TaxID=659351 RepID=A0ABM8ZQ08_9VIBR|nr:TetR/AcrR family transcriptional regulator [Vibrio stylophorae]CAH0532385.1 hypothetical protein VST7929_00214 [Vibrio stylophorae]